MKNFHCIHVVLVALACSATQPTIGQVDQLSVKHAVRVLKNIDTDKSKEWAVATLEDAVTKDTSAYVMNCLGLAYMAGLGVDADSAKSVAWFEAAGRGGFANSYHNLGMMFKYGKCGLKQDFAKSYEYFSVGADSGSVTCMYDKGFMLYKGLGCGQDYEKAAKCFITASKKQHGPSLYMLGLCYRNGYGVAKDTAKASYYLALSASLGFRDADEELARPYEETYIDGLYSNGDVRSSAPAKMPTISPVVNDVSLIDGTYKGYLVMYDWSGEYVLGEKPLAMTANRNGSEVLGMLVIGEDTVPYRAELAADGKLSFKEGRLMLPERYTTDGKVKYRIDNMLLDVWSNKISGSLGLYSLKLKEPERPMYFELMRSGGNIVVDDDRYCRIVVSPNPFEYSLEASFELKNESDVQVRMFNISGLMVWNEALGNFAAGNHTVTLSPRVKPGKYVLNIKAGEQVLHEIIIKEGGL